MKKTHNTFLRFVCLGLILTVGAGSVMAQHYTRTDLVKSSGDSDLINPWGLSRSSSSPWWVSDNGSNKSTLYSGTGSKLGLIVGVPDGPTGTVFNGTGDFQLPGGKPSIFLFASEGGSISAWTPGAASAVTVAGSASSVYKGLAIASRDGANYLYATDFRNGRVDVFDSFFTPIYLGCEAFKLPSAGYEKLVPFNVQNIGGSLIVSFAKQDAAKHDEVDGAGLGAIAAFAPDGRLLRVFEHGPWLNAPWGLVLAPGDFGAFSHMLLVGQFGSGQIAAYNVMSGQFAGLFEDAAGKPLSIDGLWGLSFGNGAGAGPATTLYFAAGPNSENSGVLGTLTPVSTDLKLGNGN